MYLKYCKYKDVLVFEGKCKSNIKRGDIKNLRRGVNVEQTES